MSAENEISVQELVNIVEMYLEAEIEELNRQLCNIRKINVELLSGQMCTEVKISGADQKREMVTRLRELAKNYK
ncbi:MAG: hypothetical protein GX568_10895 [Candidatus Gastranaerophilales bacterium]|jgi:hypothetical protein|nr:hypothetical protein [Candidatus Gastranaerophilales bacterium]